MSEAAVAAKNKGNEAFSKGQYEDAIKFFTEAINLDSSNHLLYSNRSAAYCSVKQYFDALQDAEKTVSLKPDWAKGYSRKGAALHGLGQFEDAILVYKKGLTLEPENAQLKQGLADAERIQSANANSPSAKSGSMLGKLFLGDIWTKLKANPQTSKFLDQEDYVQMINKIRNNPAFLEMYMQDQRLQKTLGVLMGINVQTADETRGKDFGQDVPQQQPPKREEPKEEKKEEKKEEPQKMEIELTETQKKAEAAKNKGNDAYKKKDFENAIKFYNEAMEIDPDNITYLLNRSAVFLEQAKYDECIKDAETAIEKGRKQYADFSVIAKAYARIGNAHMKTKNYAKAVEAYETSLTEHRTAATLDSLKKAEKFKEQAEKEAYLDPTKAQEAKERGNQFFKESKFPEAIKEYSEAMKRNPSDHTLYSNRAACYTKLGEYPHGLKDCDTCIEMKPDFVKAYSRKATIQYFMKDYQKALETYDQGLKHDENNQEIKDGITRTIRTMNEQEMRNRSGGAPDKETLERAARDPEIQQILSDPIMNQILQDMTKDPKAAENHMRNPMIAAKIQKLAAAGILRMGYCLLYTSPSPRDA
eukprot:TRINITY_DN2488_c0_g1_i4.p1 TRINITY_DN2488_c0_g1~~TRINITY_DN2488_c0_g1_i4.p1  ORF type:complete len:611 (-),score=213.86 TRINITY_DN2488_c0_g1_i4:24-1787(-)